MKRTVCRPRAGGCSALARWRVHELSGGGNTSLDKGNDEVEETMMTVVTTGFPARPPEARIVSPWIPV
jgi:hypothetical protein